MSAPGDVREDIGYMGNCEEDKIDRYHVQRVQHSDKIKIEYLNGMMAGRAFWIRKDIALDMIKHGKAREVNG